MKLHGELYWNISEFWELESPQMEAHTDHDTPGRAQAPGAWWWVVLTSYVGWSSTSGARKLIPGNKSCKRISAIGVTDLREYKKRFSARSEERETEEDRETDPISEGLSPLHSHGGHGPEGEPSSHLGGGQGRRRRRGLSPPRFRCRRSATGGNDRDDDLHQQSCYRQHQLSPPLCSVVTPLLPAVIST